MLATSIKVKTDGRQMGLFVYRPDHLQDCAAVIGSSIGCNCGRWELIKRVSKDVGLIIAAAIESGDYDSVMTFISTEDNNDG